MKIVYGNKSKQELELIVENKEKEKLIAKENLNNNTIYKIFAYIIIPTTLTLTLVIIIKLFSIFIMQILHGELYIDKMTLLYLMLETFIIFVMIISAIIKINTENKYLLPYELSEKEKLIKKLSSHELISKNITKDSLNNIKVELIFSPNNSESTEKLMACNIEFFPLKIKKTTEEEYLDIENMAIYIK